MAKLFYTAEEAAAKLGKSVQELMDMAKSGQLQEFKDRDRSLFKVEAVDQLADSGFDMDLDLKLSDGSTAADIDLGLLEDSTTGAGASGSGEIDLGLSGNDELIIQGDELSLAAEEPAASADLAAPASEAFDLDLGLGASGSQAALGLADSSAGTGAGSPAASGAAPIASSDGLDDLGLDLGLADSAAPAGQPAPIASGDDLGLDLGLDVEDSSVTPMASKAGTAGGAIGLADTGSMAGGSAAPAASGVAAASDSMAGTGAKPLLDDSLAGSSMASASRRGGDGLGNLETVGSGSGLLDLTKESDESTIGAALLDEVVEGEESDLAGMGASGIFADAGVAVPGGEDVFEAPAAAVGGGLSLATAAVAMPEVMDGGGSGLTVGLMVGALASLVVAALVLVPMTMGGGSQLAGTISTDIWMWVGALAGGTAFCGIVGFFVGRQLG